jgi:hypothetical protein
MREKNIFHFPANGLIHLICEVSKAKNYLDAVVRRSQSVVACRLDCNGRLQQCVLYDGQISRVTEQVFLL